MEFERKFLKAYDLLHTYLVGYLNYYNDET